MTRPTGTINNLQNIQYDITIDRLPEVEFRVQTANIPSISMSPPIVGTPFANQPQVGDRLEYGNFTVGFQVDENLQTWESIWEWMKVATPTKGAEYHTSKFKGSHRSDISFMIRSSMKNIIFSFKYVDAFPISMSDIQFNTTSTGMDYPILNVDFVYSEIQFLRHR